MRNFIIALTLVLSISISNAQDFKFGKISEAELAEKTHPIDASANAAVLYREEKISFFYKKEDGFMQRREVHERVKLYNKEGYKWATKNIYLYKGGSSKNEKLLSIKGYTYNLINGKKEKDKLRNDGIFEEEYNEYTEISKFTMPNIQDGAVIEYSYQIVSPFLQIDDIYFQSVIPINKLDVSVATPQFYQYNKLSNLKAFYFPKIKQEKKHKSFTSVNRSRSDGHVSNTTFSQSKSEYFDNVIVVSEENIPAVKGEAHAGNIDNYLSKMSLELSAILSRLGAIEESFSSTWEKVSKTIYDYSSFGGQLKKNNFFEDDIAELLADITDTNEKTAVIFDYVKSKVKWNGNYGYTSHGGIRKAYKEGVGNVGDINLLLIAMLKSQGINANPVLVSTKNNGIPLTPTRSGFNYVICMVEDTDGTMLLDATDHYSAPNILPARALNWQGRVVKEDGTSGWILLRPTTASVKMHLLNVKLKDDFSAEGKVTQSITSHAALAYRDQFATMNTEDHIKAIEKNKGSIEVSKLEMTNAKAITEPIKISYDYNYTDAVDEIGDNLYFTPLLFMVDKESPFKLEKRSYPIDFTTPVKERYLVNIQLPENYTIDSMPKSEIINFNDGLASYSYMLKQMGQYLQINIKFDLNKSLINPEDYQVFKDFYEKIIQKQAEQVVLKKV